MVQNTANSIIVPPLPASSPKANTAGQKEDTVGFDKVMRDQLSQDEEPKLTDKPDGKDETDAADVENADVAQDVEKLQETVCPQMMLQWMTMIPGEKQNAQNMQSSDAAQNHGGTAQNAGEIIPAVLGNETNEAVGQQQIPMDGKLSQEPVLDEKTQEVVGKQEFQLNSKELTDMAEPKQSVTETKGNTLAGKKEAVPEGEATKVAGTVEKLPDVQVKSEQGTDTQLVQGNTVPTETNSNAVQKPAVSDGQPTQFSRPEYMEKLGDTVAKALTSGKQEFEIQLNPAHLGKMLVKVSYEAGKAVISIVCSEAKTMQAMSQNAKELGSILESHMGTQTQIVVDKGQRSDYLEQQSQQEKNRQEQQPQQESKKDNENDEAEAFSFLQQLRLGLV